MLSQTIKGLYRTYKELKRKTLQIFYFVNIGLYRTYKELKQLQRHSYKSMYKFVSYL